MVNNLVFRWPKLLFFMEVTESSPTFGRENIQELRFEALQKFHPNLLPKSSHFGWVLMVMIMVQSEKRHHI